MSSNHDTKKESTKKESTKKESNEEPKVIEGSGEFLVTNNLYSRMDNNNKKAADILASKGLDAAAEHMFKHPETGKQTDYARIRY